MSSTTVRGARGGGLSLLLSPVSMALQLVSVLVLSRLLAPEDFGLIAMVQVFISLGELLKDLGLSSSALQQKHLSTQQSSNLFWANVWLSLAVFAALVASTPLVVSFYGEPRLYSIIPALGVSIIANGATAQIHVHLSRQLRFRTAIVGTICGNALGIAIAIVAATAGATYWALVFQKIGASVSILIILWIAAKWRPARFRRGNGTRQILRTGVHYWVGGLFHLLNANVTTAVIGRSFGAAELGYYNRASYIVNAVVEYLVGPLRQVVIPTLNRREEEGSDAYSVLVHVQFIIGFVVMGILTCAAVTAGMLIPLILGAGWEPSVVLFQVLAIGGCLQVLIDIAFWILMFTESSKRSMYWNALSATLVVPMVAAAAAFGIMGVVWAYVAGRVLSWISGLAFLKCDERVPVAALFGNGMILVVSAAVSFATTVLFLDGIAMSGLVLQIGLGALVSVSVFSIALVAFPSSRDSFRVLVHLIRSAVGR